MRGIRLEVVTIAWMIAEALLAIGAGIAARSVLLTAFGFDSVVELLSGVVLWRRLKFEAQGRSRDGIERMERTAARISGVLLILLCAYVVATSLGGLLLGLKPEGSILGIALSSLLGFWWLQYIAAVALLIWLVPETREALEAAAGGHRETDSRIED